MPTLIKRLPFPVKLAAIAFCILIVFILSFLLKNHGTSPAAALEKTGISTTDLARVPLYTGSEWKPTVESDGYAKALENDTFALYIQPKSTQIVLIDKRTGFRWSSNPSEEQLKSQTVKGLLLSNLKSPFALTYVRTKGKDQTIREVINALDPKIQMVLTQSAAGIQVVYTFPERKLSFAIQYELTAKGLKTRIPTDGIKEEGEFSVFNIDLLPYFGAASSDEDGYVFVPDGPGGLIRFDTKRADISKGFIHQVYGFEVTNNGNWYRSGEWREDIAYPVFGMKRGSNAFMAVLTEGGDSANIAAMPPGVKSTLFNVYSNQIYREEYLYRMSRLAAPAKAVQKQRLETDREVEYRFLNGADAGYVGMAKSYREYLTETGRFKSLLKPVEHVPLNLKIVGGDFTEAYNRIQYIPTTTFSQAGDIVDGLRKQGVANLKVTYFGWKNLAADNRYEPSPIEKAIGGEDGARELAAKLKKQGIPLLFTEDMVWGNTKTSDLSGKSNGIRGIDGTVFMEEGWFVNKPASTVAKAYDTIKTLKSIGISGIQYNDLGSFVFHDYEPSGIATRAETINIYKGLLAYTKKTLGLAGVYRGYDYSVGQVDSIDLLPHESSYDFMIDETVPFYPIALHGYVPYSFGDGNLRNNVEAEFLKAIEYGAVPSFILTHDDSRKLKYTWTSGIFSSQYEKWSDRIGDEYKKFDSLSSLFAQQIINHEKLAADKFATTYEDGTRVIVDYAQKTFAIEKGGGV
ncbi:hypothetical protein EHS13_30870 [Paenibacillus psychroresistens]|uniref:Uncharacterized protein n=1 Tax=Paenibacillus psychroresistens TaxID=1778678 RepID=A0A6B8RSS4_9BACL|nr:DUF5696 domain-containing protein [Paenibacillus psychroresistens]QGQ98969.1 hypothetical protein EHS13_30870 [Paenibacillus psychroresistens]